MLIVPSPKPASFLDSNQLPIPGGFLHLKGRLGKKKVGRNTCLSFYLDLPRFTCRAQLGAQHGYGKDPKALEVPAAPCKTAALRKEFPMALLFPGPALVQEKVQMPP